ncbi:MAG: type IX secretion system membrane protein PorP/SprF [Hymenobacter sp.]
MLAAAPALAQQVAQYSQYMNNNYLLNPGATGVEDYIDIKASYRTQWVGLEGAPKTYYLSASSSLGAWRSTPKRPLRDQPAAVSRHWRPVYNDVTGPTSRTSAYGSYAYNLLLTRDIRAALGVSVGMQQFAVDGDQLRFFDPTTVGPAPPRGCSTPRLACGCTVPISTWACRARSCLATGSTSPTAPIRLARARPATPLRRHYFFTTGVRVPIAEDWSVVPSVLVKAVSPAPLSVDLNAKIKYKDLLWAGASWRALDAVVVMAGLSYEQFTLGYSYDAGLSQLADYHSGSHEILIGLRLKKKAQEVCINKFW